MNPYTRGALFIIRLVAAGLVLFSTLQLGAYLFYFKSGKKPDDRAIVIALKAVPLLVGFGLLVKSYPLARKLTEDFDE